MIWHADELLDFEEWIAQEFAAGKIKAPIHLSGGNEKQLIKIFKDIRDQDWVLAGWRSHYHCLLKGVDPNELKTAILAGRSVSLAFPAQRVLCSGIVGGIAPIAVGLAHAIKERKSYEYVYCFLGDMTFESGIVHEAMKYAARHRLPVRWVVEDNEVSVMTPTQASWGEHLASYDTQHYYYKLTRPHSGIGAWVRF
jgi:pyruvate dehydrogenase E1 component alpha subunit